MFKVQVNLFSKELKELKSCCLLGIFMWFYFRETFLEKYNQSKQT